MTTPASQAQQQLQYIQDFLIKIADGDYNSKLPVIDNTDEQLVAVQVGINMLVEELKSSTISRSFLNSIYNGINDILIVLDDDGKIQATNHVVDSLLSYSGNELYKQPIEKLIQLNDIDTVRNCIKNAYEQDKIQEVGINLVAKDKTVIPVACSFSPLHDAQNNTTSILLVAKNMSSLINAKNQLQDKNDELNLFVYKASHDLKSPVSSMISVMNLLKKSENVSEMQLYIKMVDECITKLNTIISDLLVLGQITYGELECEKVDAKELIDTILESIEFIREFKDIDFDINIEESARFVFTEKGLLRTVFLNLIDNAIKYSKKRDVPSYIRIKLSPYKNGIVFTVEDNGIGIAQHQQENVWKMFYRATAISKGSGLGLYIVKTSVAKLGGTISLESEFDKGSVFKVYIPSQEVTVNSAIY
ncbi:MAG: PAS domain-containing sensor histidine kinase [Bacteroidia bacterium]